MLKIVFYFTVVLLLFSSSTDAFGQLLVKGKITEFQTEKPLSNVTISTGKKGTITNENGNYSLELPFGEHYITVSLIGYYKKTKYVKLSDDLTLNFDLKEEIKQMDEVIVNTTKANANIKDTQMGTIKLNMNSLKRIPVVFGENDILRALTLQPGVSTVGEGAGGINVRGGKVDQNLVTIDGAPIFNTSHLLGFFTAVNADAIQDVTLYKGAVPANLGGRLSGVLAMQSKTGNTEKVRYQLGVGVISSKISIDGPLSKKTTFMVGSRIAYPNVSIKRFPEPTNKSKADFYDLNAKLVHKFNPKNSATLSLYRSADSFKFPEDTVYSWHMNIASFHWTKVYTPKLTQTTSVLYSGYTFNVDGIQNTNEFNLESTIAHKELKSVLNYQLAKQKWDFGISGIAYQVSPSKQTPSKANSNVIEDILPKEQSREVAVFLENETTIGKRMSFTAGVRAVMYQFMGPKTVNTYSENLPIVLDNVIDSTIYGSGKPIKTYTSIEPRFSLKFETSSNSSIKIGYNRMRQFLHLISNTTAISPIDYWKLSDSYLPPQVADQVSGGFFKNLDDNNYELGLETYYKWLSDLQEYKKGANLAKNRNIETALLNADGIAYGTEFFIRKKKGDFTGIISYTYSRSFIRSNTNFSLEKINGNNYFPSNFDKPHMLNISGLKTLRYGFSYSFNFVYNTGRPITYPDGVYNFNNLPVVNYSARNLDRIPDYHRLDFSLNFETRTSKSQKNYSLWNLSIYNVYGRRNPYSIYFTSFNRVTRPYQLSVFGAAIPSITYTKYF
jgi:hypothetical protein